jgi:hypothetical protein
MGCIPTGVDSPMAYGNMYIQMPYLPTPTVYSFAASAYSPIAMLYPPTSTDIVSQNFAQLQQAVPVSLRRVLN